MHVETHRTETPVTIATVFQQLHQSQLAVLDQTDHCDLDFGEFHFSTSWDTLSELLYYEAKLCTYSEESNKLSTDSAVSIAQINHQYYRFLLHQITDADKFSNINSMYAHFPNKQRTMCKSSWVYGLDHPTMFIESKPLYQ